MTKHDLKKGIIKKLTIVAIEAEETVAKISGLVFDDIYETKFFTYAEDGLIYIQKNNQKIGLIISDVKLPEMSGLELAHEIKSNRMLRRIPIILQIGDLCDPFDLAFLKADGHIQKPYDSTQLLTEIKRVLNLNADQSLGA